MVKISVIIPTRDRLDCLKQTLASLQKQTFTDFEVIVSDDGSTDRTKSLAKQKFPFIFKLVSQPNLGRAAARNHGFSVAEGEIIVFIDDHIILDKDFLKEHYSAQQKFAKKALVWCAGA
ncbi:MAG: glycosyltransferase family 2 protein [Candidatus Margulisbacteria bacterium]|nr:glycosyltransferase family 2 protein [Candidatus Margulisiibacteriota bacterium]